MSDLLLTVLLTLLSLLFCGVALYRDQLNIWTTIPLLTIVLVIVPGATYVFFQAQEVFQYGLQRVNYTGLPHTELIAALHYISLCNLLYCFGSLFAPAVSPAIERWRDSGLHAYRFRPWASLVLLGVWGLNLLALADYSLEGLLRLALPAYFEETKFDNYIVRYIHLLIPAGIATAWAVSHRGARQFWLTGLLVAAVFFGTGQRRNLIVWIMYWVFLSLLLMQGGARPRFQMARIFAAIAFIGATSVLLWGMRVYFTNWFEGDEVSPFSVRSPFDVLFGSGASGFTSHLLVIDYIRAQGILPFYDIYHGIVQLVPRGLWEAKPVQVDHFVQEHANYPVSPSIFWFSDLLLSFGQLPAYLLSFLLPIALAALSRSFIRAGGMWLFIGLWTLASFFALFKNGFSPLMASIETFVIFAVPCFLLCARKLAPQEQPWPQLSVSLP